MLQLMHGAWTLSCIVLHYSFLQQFQTKNSNYKIDLLSESNQIMAKQGITFRWTENDYIRQSMYGSFLLSAHITSMNQIVS